MFSKRHHFQWEVFQKYHISYTTSPTNYDFRAVLYRSRVSCDVLLIHKDSTIDVSAIIPFDGNGGSTAKSYISWFIMEWMEWMGVMSWMNGYTRTIRRKIYTSQ